MHLFCFVMYANELRFQTNREELAFDLGLSPDTPAETIHDHMSSAAEGLTKVQQAAFLV